jgi:hypothetical protein
MQWELNSWTDNLAMCSRGYVTLTSNWQYKRYAYSIIMNEPYLDYTLGTSLLQQRSLIRIQKGRGSNSQDDSSVCIFSAEKSTVRASDPSRGFQICLFTTSYIRIPITLVLYSLTVKVAGMWNCSASNSEVYNVWRCLQASYTPRISFLSLITIQWRILIDGIRN